ncbi:MAG: peptidoglycan -binding protein [Alphaproteobacteria bacterium]
MSAQTRRRRRHGLDIWPGFVDALATLVMVIVFVLMIFTLFQFHLKDMISGRDQALDRLSLRIGELADQLAVERRASAGLRDQVGALSSQLAGATSIRDRLQSELAIAEGRLREIAGALDAARGRADQLAGALAGRDAEARDLAARLQGAEGRASAAEAEVTLTRGQVADLLRQLAATATRARDGEARATASADQAAELARRLEQAETRLREAEGRVVLGEREAAELARRLAASEQRAQQADARLADAVRSVAADREKIEVQLRELDALRRNIEALTILRDQFERDLATRNTDLRGAGEALAAERRLSADAQFRVDMLARQLAELRGQLGRLEVALDASEARSRDQQVQIVDLGRRLNLALSSKVEELARYRSEFFGRLREVLGERADVRVVGDRFIFETEVLFQSASATLEPEGRRQIEGVASALTEIAARIPAEVNWILQVEGHTDRRPIARSFASNWELSHARAMSVVRALIAGGVPADRLGAAGYAEFQPVDPRDDEGAYRRNRRIELRLTSR